MPPETRPSPSSSSAWASTRAFSAILLLIFFEFRLQRLAEAHGLGRDDMLQRAALGTRENSLVDGLGVLLLAQDQAAAGAAQRFVGGGCHHVGIGHGVRVQASGHKPRDVRHIHHKQRAVFPGDLRDAFKINGAGVGRSARDDHLGLVLLCFFLQIRHNPDSPFSSTPYATKL